MIDSQKLKSVLTLAAVVAVTSIAMLSTSAPASADDNGQGNAPAKKHKKKAVVDEVSGQGYGMAGCGLGSIAMGDKPGMIQVLAATTNGTFGSQTFGISSGTSNCEPSGMGSRSASLFITANREALEKEIARGSGESVRSLAQVMGCADSAQLGQRLQARYTAIFPRTSASTEAVANEIMSTGCDSQVVAKN